MTSWQHFPHPVEAKVTSCLLLSVSLHSSLHPFIPLRCSWSQLWALLTFQATNPQSQTSLLSLSALFNIIMCSFFNISYKWTIFKPQWQKSTSTSQTCFISNKRLQMFINICLLECAWAGEAGVFLWDCLISFGDDHWRVWAVSGHTELLLLLRGSLSCLSGTFALVGTRWHAWYLHCWF